jgi:hypothetical protein
MYGKGKEMLMYMCVCIHCYYFLVRFNIYVLVRVVFGCVVLRFCDVGEEGWVGVCGTCNTIVALLLFLIFITLLSRWLF